MKLEKDRLLAKLDNLDANLAQIRDNTADEEVKAETVSKKSVVKPPPEKKPK